MKQNTKIMWGVVAFIVAAVFVIYLYPRIQERAKVEVPQEEKKASLILQGNITAVDTKNLTLTIMTAPSAKSFASVEKTVTIEPSTKIEKVISQKNASGIVEKQALIEVDIPNVLKGSLATIEYTSEKDSVLGGVSRVVFVVEGDVDAYMKQTPQPSASAYVKGEVVSVDLTGKSLQYKPHIFDIVGATTMSITIPEGASVYRVDDPLRVSIIHAWETATLADVKYGQTIFFVMDKKLLEQGKLIPQAFIIAGK
ncbi:MAG: hypothetical protein ACYCZ7_00530 [Minisyncoccota bacterium]